MRKCLLAVALACASALAGAASRVVPTEPTAFELVNLRMDVDICAFVSSTVHVTMVASTLRVTQQMNNCLLPGARQIVDVGLGMLPAGDYRVEIYGGSQATGAPLEALAFQVREGPQIAIFPPPARPLTDYSGLWYDPRESGWGLSIHQGSGGGLFAVMYVYGAGSQPEWYSIQAGGWSSSTVWSGTVYRTTGPSLFAPAFDPQAVFYSGYGNATLDFTQLPAQSGVARFDYTIQGVTRTKSIQRMRL